MSQINTAQDLKALDQQQLQQLAEELRAYILEVVSQNGGHLAPNLGVVELTLALHRVFDLPEDKIVWDVGHQCYAHKILTGRREQFPTLRTYGGISGFPNPAESEYDSFHSGHSSTSISVALGLATARDLQGQDHQVVAVIGDGALTAGLAYEGLNHAGDSKTPLIVVLNDNEMSIANNVGAMSQHLARLRSHPRYHSVKRKAYSAMRSLPLGARIRRLFDRVKDSVKYFVISSMLFEELGFVYLGPIDGHDVELMREMLERAKAMKKPVLLHVVTEKGRGYLPAAQNPQRFHGTAPFDIETGLLRKGSEKLAYTQIFGQTLLAAAEHDSRLVAITAAMADGVGLLPFAKEYPQRFFDVGIAEQHAVTFAAGLAKAGLHPVVAVYSTFLQRAYDQVLHDVCLPGLPVVLAVDRAGLVGDDGPTHHGVFDLTYLRSLPNLRLLAPADGAELRLMLEWAFRQDCPVAVRYPRGYPLELNRQWQPIAEGGGQLLREGGDVLIAACGSMVAVALEVAEILARQGIAAAVWNARFVSPLDQAFLQQELAKSGRLVTMEENISAGGFGSACLEILQEPGSARQAEVEVVALPQRFLAHGATDRLKEEYGLTADQVARRIQQRWFGKE